MISIETRPACKRAPTEASAQVWAVAALEKETQGIRVRNP
jgi:hypothetical protein